MLKKDFDIFYHDLLNRRFLLICENRTARMYGKVIKESPKVGFIQTQLLEFIFMANMTRNPNNAVYVPRGIAIADFTKLVSNLKNQLI